MKSKKNLLPVVVIATLLAITVAIVSYRYIHLRALQQSLSNTNPIPAIITGNIISDDVEECLLFFVPETERVSGLIMSCEGGFFSLSLTRERLSQIQETFDQYPEIINQTIGVEESVKAYPMLTFSVTREWLAGVTAEIAADDDINSVVLVKEVPRSIVTNIDNIPKGEYWIKAFFTPSMTERVYNDFQVQPGDVCVFDQAINTEGTISGTYVISYVQIVLMRELFLNNSEAQFATYDTEIRLPETAIPEII